MSSFIGKVPETRTEHEAVGRIHWPISQMGINHRQSGVMTHTSAGHSLTENKVLRWNERYREESLVCEMHIRCCANIDKTDSHLSMYSFLRAVPK